MNYLTLKLSTAAQGMLYEKDFSAMEVFESFVRARVSDLVTLGFLKERQLYWVKIIPGYDDHAFSDQVQLEQRDGNETSQPPGQSWLSFDPGASATEIAPMRFFALELHTLPPDVKVYRKDFLLKEIDYFSNDVKKMLQQAQLISTDEPIQVDLYAHFGDMPRSGREIFHKLPEELSNFQISLEPIVQERTFPEKPMPTCSCGHAGEELDGHLVIFCKLDGLLRLSRDVQQNATRSKEIGGILIGQVFKEPGSGRLYIEVEDYIPAEHTVADAISLRFTHKTWNALREQKQEHFPDPQLIVGWYHTHPPGVVGRGSDKALSVRFFSREDMAMQRDFFSEPWQVALVMDAATDEKCFFSWEGDLVVESAYHVYS